MWSLPFIFFGWGFWAIYDFRVTPRVLTIGAVCCFVAFVAAGVLTFSYPYAGFGMLVCTWIVYACLGAYHWANLDGDPRILYPEILFRSERG